MQSLNDLWSLCMDKMHENFSANTISLWFAEIKLIHLDESYAVFACESELKQKFIENNYTTIIAGYLDQFIGYTPEVHIYLGKEETIDFSSLVSGKVKQIREEEEYKKTARSNEPFINADYTFENFIVGSSNKFAHAACTAVSNNPASEYNPLFIYGASGLGKTHLLYAITNRIREKHPHMNIIYVKCEDFTNQMIESIRSNNTRPFREKYRTADVLLIDDIQFIARKTGTQEEFFNTFNTLYEDQKQIIMTSDRPPKDINPLEERLKTRFEWGLLADIIPPDFELRVAIIKDKAQKLGISMSNDVANFLADNLRSNIRQIEGVLKKISAQSFLTGTLITMDTATECISGVLSGKEPVNVTIEKILDRVSRKYGIPIPDIKSRKRTKDIARTRHICIYIVRKMTQLSLTEIGSLFGRDHSTIMSSVDYIESEIKENTLLEFEIKELMDEIREG